MRERLLIRTQWIPSHRHSDFNVLKQKKAVYCFAQLKLPGMGPLQAQLHLEALTVFRTHPHLPRLPPWAAAARALQWALQLQGHVALTSPVTSGSSRGLGFAHTPVSEPDTCPGDKLFTGFGGKEGGQLP